VFQRKRRPKKQAVLITGLGLGHRPSMMYGQHRFGFEQTVRESKGVEMKIKGGCLCGAVRYTAEAGPTSATVCHCRDCQKFTGSAFAALVRVTKESLTIEGTLKTFTSLGGSGNPILRHFCPECGSSIAEEPGTRPGMIILNVGTFDDPTVAKAGREIFRDDALPWIEVHGEIPRFAKRPD
jgi:hypothetical protein